MYPVAFNRIPEKWYPGRFNIWVSLVVQCMAPRHTNKTDMIVQFASHQIFHIFVVIAAISHYIGVTRAIKFWHNNPGLCAIY
jgi:adiponectin receptor